MRLVVKIAAVAVAAIAVAAGAALVVGEDEEPIVYGFGIALQTDSSKTVDDGLLPDGWEWMYVNIIIYNESEVDIDETELPTALVDGDGDGEAEEYEATAWFSYEVSDSSGKQHYRWVIWYAVPAVYLDGELVEDMLVNGSVELSYPGSWTEYSS